jgi:hypothetical protein
MQPYDDGGLREVLFTENCAPPCFLGIRPGVTTVDEAFALLQAHPWVEAVESSGFGGQELFWRWNGTQPAFLRDNVQNQILVQSGIVYQIDLFTSAEIGMFVIQFGFPDGWYSSSWTITNSGTTTGIATYFVRSALYYDNHFKVKTLGLCPMSGGNEWELPSEISVFASFDQVGYDFTPRAIPILPEGCR